MRKLIILVVVSLIAAVSYFGYAHFSGGAVPTFGLPLGGEKAKIRNRTHDFFEHVKFKNASAFKDFVSSDDPDEVARYLTKTMGVSPEQMDLTNIAIKHIELDSLQLRARVKVSFAGKNLLDRQPLETEKIIFLFRTPDDKWMVDIKSLSP